MKETKRKYHNRPREVTTKSGITIKFDSTKEAARYITLMEMLERGEIRDLKLQPTFVLVEGYTTPGGERIRPMIYKADFSYIRQAGRKDLPDWRSAVNAGGVYVVEDIKGGKATQTAEFLLKKKLFEDRYGMQLAII